LDQSDGSPVEIAEARAVVCCNTGMTGDRRPIGIFDSGIGGFSVLAEVRSRLPAESLLYVADHRFAPYGDRSLDEVARRSVQLSGQLIEAGAKVIVVACNSASAAALYTLRETYPETPFVGMEPAVKPATVHSESGVVGVLATAATFQGELFASLVDRHGNGTEVLPIVGGGLADLVEAGAEATPEAKQAVADLLTPALDRGMDTLVLGCTHYSFLTATIATVTGDRVTIIDPASAVAQQVERVLDADALRSDADRRGRVLVTTTGDVDRVGVHVERRLGEADEVRHW
jgi:glutamate racemase